MDSASADLKSSALDLLAAMLTGRDPDAARWSENRHLLVLLTTSLAVLVGCGVAPLLRGPATAAATSARREEAGRA
jgi:NADPH-ferrihemoprotein reductase